MSGEVSYRTKWTWHRNGFSLVLLALLIIACVVMTNGRHDRGPGRSGGSVNTAQRVEERVGALRAAVLRLERQGISAEEQDRAFHATCKAIYELEELHSQAAPAVPLLVGVLSGPERHDSLGDVSLRAVADTALRHIGRPALEPVVGLLNHKDTEVRSLAALTISAWASRRTKLPADIPLADLQIAVPAIKEALSRETDELTKGGLRFALCDVNREEALRLGIQCPAMAEDVP